MSISYVFNPFTSSFDAVDTVTLGAVGSTPNANGATVVNNLLTLQPADASFPGLVTTSSQTFAGSKTFSSLLNADGGVDRSTSGTLTIGATNSSIINIGNSGATVNIQGTTIYENTPQLLVADPLITVNSGGGAGSGQNSGIQIEEGGVITGYAQTSSNRDFWQFKAPNQAGIALIEPGASGIILDQSSHNPVTIGTANGLSLVTQVLSLALSSTSTTGALSSTDWNTFNNKQSALSLTNLTDTGTDGIVITNGTGAVIGASPVTIAQHVADSTHNGYLSSTDWSTFSSKQAAGNYITALTGDATASGPGSVALTLATVNSNVGSFGTATQVGSFTVNAKGLITAASNTSIQIAESKLINLVSDLAGKQATGNYITALTGDVTATGPNSATATLATVNSNVGTFGSSTVVPVVTVNAKGLVTAVTTAAIAASTPIYAPPTQQRFTTGSGTYNKDYTFIITSGSATVGATYTNNSVTFTVYATVASAVQVVMSGSGVPTASGTLTKTGGTGDSTLTFTQSLAPLYLRVRAVGGGGGGDGGGPSHGTGGAGGTTTFGSSLITCTGGLGGAGVAGSATIGIGAVGTAYPGSVGGPGTGLVNADGGAGANSPFAGAGPAGANGTSTAGSALPNTGSGGGGGGGTAAAGSSAAGSSGGFIDAIIAPVSATYAYAIGVAGSSGGGGTGGGNGGAGGSGYVEVTEYYQ